MTEHIREEIQEELDDIRGVSVPAAIAETLDESLTPSGEEDSDLPLDPRIPSELAKTIAQNHSPDDLVRLAKMGVEAGLHEVRDTYRDVQMRNVAMSTARYVLGLKPLPETQHDEPNQEEGEQ